MPHGVALATVRAVHSAEHPTDAELLSAHAGGDRLAFERLLSRHRAALRRLARLRCGSAEDADDALQDALLSVHRAAGSFRRDAAVGSWLHRIVLNACTDRLRRAAARPTAALPDEPAPVGDRCGEVETAILVRRALMRLPAGQRAAVLAVDMFGYTVTEAAALLGVAEGTVKSRRARARARLAVLLAHLAPAARSDGCTLGP